MSAASASEDQIWAQVRQEVFALESELGQLERVKDERTRQIAELRAPQRGQLSHVSGTSDALKQLMAELRATQQQIKAESEKHLSLSEAVDEDNTRLYKARAQNTTLKTQRDEAARQLRELAQEHDSLSQQLLELRAEESTGEEQLRTLEEMQAGATARLHEAQAAELSAQGEETVAEQMALMEGLRALNPQLQAEVDETTRVVQERNGALVARMEQRNALQRQVEQRSGADLTGGVSPPPYSAQLLEVLRQEHDQVRALQGEVEAAREAAAVEEESITRELGQLGSEISNIKVEQTALSRRFEAGTALIEKLTKQREGLSQGTMAAHHRAEELRGQLGRGDEIMAQRMQDLRHQLQVQRAIREQRRKAEAEIEARHAAEKERLVADLRRQMAEQERVLATKLQQAGLGPEALGRRRARAEAYAGSVRGSAVLPAAAAPSAAGSELGGASGLGSPPAGHGSMRAAGSSMMGGGRIAEMIATNDNPNVRAAALKVQRALAREL